MTGPADRARHLAERREQYESAGIDVGSVDPDPVAQWQRWYDEAVEADLVEPNAMVVSTVDEQGAPDSRVVLARAVDQRGVVFYTNYDSAKSLHLDLNSRVAVNFAWLELHRQVRLRGIARRLDSDESDRYFASRPRESQVGAWASPQSSPIENREDLERLVAVARERFDGEVPRPPHWGGWLIIPTRFEFWQGRPHRLHDRIRYERDGAEWRVRRLAP